MTSSNNESQMSSNDIIRGNYLFFRTDNKSEIENYFKRAQNMQKNLIITSTDGKVLLRCFSNDGVLVIPEGIETIRTDSFLLSGKINSLIIPKSLKVISDYAFYLETVIINFKVHPQNKYFTVLNNTLYNHDLTELIKAPQFLDIDFEIPASVNRIRACAFSRCNLRYLKIPEKVSMIGDDAFHGCKNLETVILPKNIKSLKEGTFYSCEELRNIELPEKLSAIDDYCFYNCKKLKRIKLPYELCNLGFSVFAGCSALESIHINPNLKELHDNATSDCSSLKLFEIENSDYFSIINNILYNKEKTRLIKVPQNYNKKELIIPEGVKAIDERALSSCSEIEKITLPNSLIIIGERAFSNMEKLRDMALPENIRIIGAYAFSGCSALESINIPRNITRIGKCTFYNCRKLKSVKIENSKVTRIEEEAFAFCINLASIMLPISLKTIDSYAFSSTGLTKVSIPSNVSDIQVRAFDECHDIKIYEVSHDNRRYFCQDGIIYDRLLNKLVRMPPKSTIESFNIPSFVRTIEQEAFQSCNSLKSINIPPNVEEIGSLAFDGCKSLESVILNCNISEIPMGLFWGCNKIYRIVLPPSTISIDECAFQDCAGLKEIVLPEQLEEINEEAFKGCKSLVKIKLNSKLEIIEAAAFSDCLSLKEINIPKEINKIDSSLFEGCKSLNKITIPQDVNIIEESAFKGCSSLKEVALSGHIREIGKKAFEDCYNLRKVIFNKGTIQIKDFCFLGCYSLKKIVINDTSFIEQLYCDKGLDGISTDCEIIVPFGQKELYKRSSLFGQFRKIKEHFVF